MPKHDGGPRVSDTQTVKARDLHAGVRVIWPSGWITVIGVPAVVDGTIQARDIAGSCGVLNTWDPDDDVVIRP